MIVLEALLRGLLFLTLLWCVAVLCQVAAQHVADCRARDKARERRERSWANSRDGA